MNLIKSLLILVGCAMANPFHMGATWEWKVIVYGDTGRRFAQVVDSQPDTIAGQTIWTLKIGDSSRQANWDTAKLLEVPKNGKYPAYWSWIKGSLRLPLEPGNIGAPGVYSWSRNGSAVPTVDAHGSLLPWGVGAFSGSQVMPFDGVSTNGGIQIAGFEWGAFYDSPKLIWDSDFGWLGATWWPADEGGFDPHVDWILVAKDGKSIPDSAFPLYPLALPDSGAVWKWEVDRSSLVESYLVPWQKQTYEKSDTSYFVQWQFRSRRMDSSGWAGIRVRELKTGSDGRSDSSWLELRWNRRKQADFEPLSAGFCQFGDDYFVSGMRERSYVSGSGYAGMGRGGTSRGRVLLMRPLGGLDSAITGDSTTDNSNQVNINWSTEVIRLLQVDDSVIRQPTPMSVRRVFLRATLSLRDLPVLARQFPSAMLQVRDARGRVWNERLDRFQASRGKGAVGVRWIQLTLPDGRRLTGSVVD